MKEIKINLKGNGHPRFYELLREIGILHDLKNKDYSKKGSPLSNFKECEDFGIDPWKGVMVRLSDKWSRAKQLTLTNSPSVESESILDTFRDMAVYSLIALILYEEKKE